MSEEGVFRFELNETLYFESGQEVAEIIGISLDPEISIQTFHEYISIRGVIELSGDYHKVPLPDALDEDPLEMNGYHEKSFIEQVVDKTDTHAAFVHRFPVEISIPSYRVHELEDVTVQVASFDYEIPNHHQMKLMATIEIDGLIEQYMETNDEPEIHTDQEQTVDETQPETHDEEPQQREENDRFQNDETEDETEKESAESDKNNSAIGKTETEENTTVNVSVDTDEDVTGVNDNTEITESESIEDENGANDHVNEKESSPVQKDEKKSKNVLPLSDFFKTKEAAETDHDDSIQQDTPESDNTSHVETNMEEENTIKTNEQSVENEQNQTPIHSLSDMFEHDSEDKYTKMRLCIVQDDDTIETIAERYEITANQLILKNRLNDESISEGQLLYIPVKESK